MTEGVTVIVESVKLLLHTYDPLPEAESVVLVPCVIVTLFHAEAVGTGLTITDALALSEQAPIDTVTEYVVDDEGATKIIALVDPVFQE